MDDGTLNSKWNFIPKDNFGSHGLIQSTDDACLCMGSTSQWSGTPITLAFCDRNDPSQVWEQSPPTSPTNAGYWAFQNAGFRECLAEGPNHTLSQSDCDFNNAEQLWRTWDVNLGNYQDPF